MCKFARFCLNNKGIIIQEKKIGNKSYNIYPIWGVRPRPFSNAYLRRRISTVKFESFMNLASIITVDPHINNKRGTSISILAMAMALRLCIYIILPMNSLSCQTVALLKSKAYGNQFNWGPIYKRFFVMGPSYKIYIIIPIFAFLLLIVDLQ